MRRRDVVVRLGLLAGLLALLASPLTAQPRWTAVSALLMSLGTGTNIPLEVSSANPLPVSITGTVSGTGLLFPDGTVAAPSIAFASAPTEGFFYSGGIALASGSSVVSAWVAGNLRMGNAWSMGWVDTGNALTGILDTILIRDSAANTLAMKNGTTAQTFRVYGTTTGNKYLILTHDGTNPTIGSSSGALKVDSTAITPAASGVRFLCISTTGVIVSQAAACVGT